jgi:hypothetical protein
MLSKKKSLFIVLEYPCGCSQIIQRLFASSTRISILAVKDVIKSALGNRPLKYQFSAGVLMTLLMLVQSF